MSSDRLFRSLAFIAALTLCSFSCVYGESEEEAYTQVISERVGKITEGMTFSNPDQAERVRALIADQYRTLRDIHAARDSQVSTAKDTAAVAGFEQQAKLAMFEAHNRFLAQLNAELPCDQVEKVKDGLTYGVLHHTYNGYLGQLPDLNDEQKRAIRAYLLEAREVAMDQGSADEKHDVFRKYKGRINNYLSKAGYKM